MNKKLIWCAVTFLLNATSCWASTLVSYGDGTNTFDTATGLLWLDLRESVNRSFLDVSANFGPQGDFSGYRYATASEVLSLWSHAGLIGSGTILSCTGWDCIYAERVAASPVRDFVELFGGRTWEQNFPFDGLIGLSSTLSVACSGCGYTAYMTPELRIYENGSADAEIVEGLRDYISSPSYASWLVSNTAVSAIPIPTTVWLFISGISGLGVFARRRNA